MLRDRVPGPVPNSKQLGFSIRERREEQKLTIEQLASEAGVDTSYLSGIERLGRNPSWSKLARIVAALDIDASELIERAEQIALSDEIAPAEHHPDGDRAAS